MCATCGIQTVRMGRRSEDVSVSPPSSSSVSDPVITTPPPSRLTSPVSFSEFSRPAGIELTESDFIGHAYYTHRLRAASEAAAARTAYLLYAESTRGRGGGGGTRSSTSSAFAISDFNAEQARAASAAEEDEEVMGSRGSMCYYLELGAVLILLFLILVTITVSMICHP
jgi:hypothetical protein